LIVVLDTGGVEGVAPIDEARSARPRLLRERADDFVMPAAVLAESVLTRRRLRTILTHKMAEVVDRH
jgi:hypothetical protein